MPVKLLSKSIVHTQYFFRCTCTIAFITSILIYVCIYLIPVFVATERIFLPGIYDVEDCKVTEIVTKPYSSSFFVTQVSVLMLESSLRSSFYVCQSGVAEKSLNCTRESYPIGQNFTCTFNRFKFHGLALTVRDYQRASNNSQVTFQVLSIVLIPLAALVVLASLVIMFVFMSGKIGGYKPACIQCFSLQFATNNKSGKSAMSSLISNLNLVPSRYQSIVTSTGINEEEQVLWTDTPFNLLHVVKSHSVMVLTVVYAISGTLLFWILFFTLSYTSAFIIVMGLTFLWISIVVPVILHRMRTCYVVTNQRVMIISGTPFLAVMYWLPVDQIKEVEIENVKPNGSGDLVWGVSEYKKRRVACAFRKVKNVQNMLDLIHHQQQSP